MGTVNGIDTDALAAATEDFRRHEGRGIFRFRTSTRWIEGGRNEATIEGFYGVLFAVQSDASPEELEELARFSPVLDVVSNGTPVLVSVKTGAGVPA